MDNFYKKISFALTLSPTLIQAHGAGSFPPSRQWLCSGGATPNLGVGWNGNGGPNICKPQYNTPDGYDMNQIIVNWSGLSQADAGGFLNSASYQKDPREKHIQAMGGMKSSVCSGGSNNVQYAAANNPNFALNLGGFDQMNKNKQNPKWPITEYPTPMTSGQKYTFEYACSACHKTKGKGYVDSYITKKDVDFTSGKELTWEDFEETPFCRFNENTGLTDFRSSNFNEFDCTIPSDRLGNHVIFQVWQRDDSPEAFYSCADVILGQGADEPEEVPTTTTKKSTTTTTIKPIITTTQKPETPDFPKNENSNWNLIHSDGKIYFNNNKNLCLQNINSELKLTSNINQCTEWTYLSYNNLKIKNSNQCLSFQFTRDHGISLKTVENCDENSENQRFAYDHDSGNVKFQSNYEQSTSFDFCLRKSLVDDSVVVGFCQVLNPGLEEYLRFGVAKEE